MKNAKTISLILIAIIFCTSVGINVYFFTRKVPAPPNLTPQADSFLLQQHIKDSTTNAGLTSANARWKFVSDSNSRVYQKTIKSIIEERNKKFLEWSKDSSSQARTVRMKEVLGVAKEKLK